MPPSSTRAPYKTCRNPTFLGSCNTVVNRTPSSSRTQTLSVHSSNLLANAMKLPVNCFSMVDDHSNKPSMVLKPTTQALHKLSTTAAPSSVQQTVDLDEDA